MASKLSKYKLSSRLDSYTKGKSLKQMYKSLVARDHPYLSLPRISVKPPKKLCDLTGLPAPYKCPRTALRFYNLSVFKYLRSLSSERSEKYYEMKTYGQNLTNYRR